MTADVNLESPSPPRFLAGEKVAKPDEGAALAQSETKISVRDFDFFYGTAKVLHGISLEIPARKVTALIGPSGCGKSTSSAPSTG